MNILAEMLAAKLPAAASLFETKNLYLFAMIFVGCALLLFGYAIGYNTTKNIWVVTAVAISALLIIEPTLAYILFHQLPEKGALLGFLLGAVGLIVTLVWR